MGDSFKQIRLISIFCDADTRELNELLRHGYKIEERISLLGGYKYLLEKNIGD